jgi:hypothetical protein
MSFRGAPTFKKKLASQETKWLLQTRYLIACGNKENYAKNTKPA